MEEIFVKCFSCLSNQVLEPPSLKNKGPIGPNGIIGTQGQTPYKYQFSDTLDAYCSNYQSPKIYSIVDINYILLDFYINPFKKKQYIKNIKNWSNIMYNNDCTLYVKKGLCHKCNIDQYLFDNKCIVCISKI